MFMLTLMLKVEVCEVARMPTGRLEEEDEDQFWPRLGAGELSSFPLAVMVWGLVPFLFNLSIQATVLYRSHLEDCRQEDEICISLCHSLPTHHILTG